MSDTVTLGPGTVQGAVRVPGSKSITHRAYLLAAQSIVPCIVARPLRSADTDATLACLHRLGFQVRPEEGMVRFLPAQPVAPHEPLDCRNAGTTLRLLTATAARFPFPVRFAGDASLSGRPNAPLLEAIRSLGARVDSDGRLPYVVQGPLAAGTVALPASTSSQYASALLLALPFVPGDSQVALASPVSSGPYLDVTCRVARDFGIVLDEVEASGRAFHVPGGQVVRQDRFVVEGDWSTAAFPAVAAAITQGTVTLQGLRRDSAQGDRLILDHLEAFGARVDRQDDNVTVKGGPLQSPGVVDVAQTPDAFPALCVLAACAKGETRFTGGGALRHKESDRIRAMAEGLATMGVDVSEHDDGLTVHGGTLHGATIHAHDDHRIHMAFAVAALAAQGETTIDGAASAAVSYPGFHDDLAALLEVPA